jgi:hypothetical protein
MSPPPPPKKNLENHPANPAKQKQQSPPRPTTESRTEVPPLGLLLSTQEATDEACPLDLDETDDAWRNVSSPSRRNGPIKGERQRLGKVRVSVVDVLFVE